MGKSFVETDFKKEIEGLRKSRLERMKSENKNNMSYWLWKMAKAGFIIPKTQIIKICDKWLEWLCSDDYEEDEIEEFTEYVMKEMEPWAKEKTEWFIKTGTFSNKFNFESCYVDYIHNLGSKFLDVFYNGWLVGAGNNDELVIREYLKPKEDVLKIYNGLPLRGEIRVFYDFDKNEIIDWFDYWDEDYMEENKKSLSAHDYANLKVSNNKLKAMNKMLFNLVKSNSQRFKAVEGLSGLWSVDFLLHENSAYLIDMAVGERSAYYNWIGNGRFERDE